MRFFLALLVIFLSLNAETYDINENFNVRSYQTNGAIEYSVRLVLVKTKSTRTVLIYRQKYDPMENETKNDSIQSKFIYYFKASK